MSLIESRIISWRLPTQEQRIRRSLIVFYVAVTFHTVLDPAITYLAVIQFEQGFEANPFIRSWLHAGLLPFVFVHLPVYVLCIGGGLTLRRLLQQAAGREQIVVYYLSIVGFSGLSCWGLLIVLNNLWVIWARV